MYSLVHLWVSHWAQENGVPHGSCVLSAESVITKLFRSMWVWLTAKWTSSSSVIRHYQNLPPSQPWSSTLIYKGEIQTTQVSGSLKTAPYQKEPALSLCWFWISPLRWVFMCVTRSTLSGSQSTLLKPICKCSNLIFSLYAPHRKQLQR